MWYHLHRSQQRRLVGVGQSLVVHVLHPVRDDGEVHRLLEVFAAQGLSEIEETVEAALLVTMEEAGARTHFLVDRDHPEVHDPVRELLMLGEVPQECVVSLAPAFGRQRIGAVA